MEMSYYTRHNKAATSAIESVVEVDGIKFGVYWSATASACSEFDSEFGPMGWTEFTDYNIEIESVWSLKDETEATISKIEAELEKLAPEMEYEII